MNRHVSRAAILLSTTLLGACAQANVEQEKSALLALDQEWAKTTKDTAKFLSYYAPDATLYPPAMPKAAGTQAVKGTIEGMFATPGLALQITPVKADVGAGGDVGYTIGTYTASMKNAAGNPMTETGKYVAVWKKQADGQWKVVEDIFNADAPDPVSSAHVMVASGAMAWGPAPPSLPAGAKMAVVSGDPSMPGPFTLRAQMPAGYKIAPHWHPTDEHVTVLSGTVALGMGDTFDEAGLKDLPAGGYAALPATMHHYFAAKTAATIQVHGMGPFAINYVNAADDPSKK